MKKICFCAALSALVTLSGCYSEGINYSRALFKHIPDDPELLVLVRPNDVSDLAEMAVAEMQLQEFFGDKLQIDTNLDTYRNLTGKLLETLGIPWSEVEAIGVLMFYSQPVVLVSGGFSRDAVNEKIKEIGFTQHDNGYFDYVYDDQKLYVADDGLIMMAKEELLDDLAVIPDEKRLWNRPDFKDYRTTSPLDNSIFVWSTPPKDFLSGFKYRDDLGDVSVAINFRSNLSFKSTVRVKDPEKVVYLHDILFGTVKLSSGLFGDDPDYGPVFRGIQVTQDNQVVTASLIVSADQLKAVKARLVDDFNNPNSETFERFRKFMDGFQ